jgi:hypothetical protein
MQKESNSRRATDVRTLNLELLEDRQLLSGMLSLSPAPPPPPLPVDTTISQAELEPMVMQIIMQDTPSADVPARLVTEVLQGNAVPVGLPVDGPAPVAELHSGVLLFDGASSFATTDDKTVPETELPPGMVPVHSLVGASGVPSLVNTSRQGIDQIQNLSGDLFSSLARMGLYPWFLGLTIAAVTYEFNRRRAARPSLGLILTTEGKEARFPRFPGLADLSPVE